MPPNLTKEITDGIIASHRKYGWRAEKEALFSPRRIDVLAIAPFARQVIGFEIKVSREDFRNEIRTPQKRAAVMQYCTQFYFVVPYGLLEGDEIPDGCGLVYYWRGRFLPSLYSPGKSEPLVFDLVERDRRDELRRIQLQLEEIKDSESEHADSIIGCQLPHWMVEAFREPLTFAFDVVAVASTMASVFVPRCTYDFDEVPF